MHGYPQGQELVFVTTILPADGQKSSWVDSLVAYALMVVNESCSPFPREYREPIKAACPYG